MENPTPTTCSTDSPDPAHLVALSIALGMDMTEEGNLQDRLDAVADGTRGVCRDLNTLKTHVREYEKTVDSHDPVDLSDM